MNTPLLPLPRPAATPTFLPDFKLLPCVDRNLTQLLSPLFQDWPPEGRHVPPLAFLQRPELVGDRRLSYLGTYRGPDLYPNVLVAEVLLFLEFNASPPGEAETRGLSERIDAMAS